MKCDKVRADYCVGIDLHKKQAACCVMDREGEERRQERAESSR
jgi:hypothetical protein